MESSAGSHMQVGVGIYAASDGARLYDGHVIPFSG